MTRELTCIGCPMGCELTVEVENGVAVSVSGNTCKIGENYAKSEISAPTRVITTTALSADGRPVAVKTAAPVPKGQIFECLEQIKATTISLPAHIGDVLIESVCGTGVPVVVTRNVD